MSEASFCKLFCNASQCSPEDFDKKLFWLCLYPHATLLARFLWLLNRQYFKQDLELIRLVKHLSHPDEVEMEVKRFRCYRSSAGFFRGWLKVRVSGQRVMEVAGRLFAEGAVGQSSVGSKGARSATSLSSPLS